MLINFNLSALLLPRYTYSKHRLSRFECLHNYSSGKLEFTGRYSRRLHILRHILISVIHHCRRLFGLGKANSVVANVVDRVVFP